MQVIHYDAPHDDEAGRIRLYGGEIFVYSPTQTTRDYCAFADEMCREAFDGLAPELAQHEIPVERMVEILKDLKPRFIHHPESKRFLESILAERGCDPDDIHYDVPRLRTSTSNGYLTSGIAYAWHPHRDTWYSAPGCQLRA